uniref:Uncharacterized protein n=1 Tax=Strigamia maritima TaxID=126957 RepID=T1JHB2_STRMM
MRLKTQWEITKNLRQNGSNSSTDGGQLCHFDHSASNPLGTVLGGVNIASSTTTMEKKMINIISAQMQISNDSNMQPSNNSQAILG